MNTFLFKDVPGGMSDLFGQNPYESIYGPESEYISFFAIEYEYNYPWRDMDLSPV